MACPPTGATSGFALVLPTPPQGGSEISSLPGRLHTPNHEIRPFPTASTGTGRDLSLQRRIPHRSGLAKERRRGIRRKGRSRATKKPAGSASRRARVFSLGSGGGSGSLDKGFQGRHACFVLRLPNSFSRHELLVFQFNISPHRSDTPVNKHALNQNTRRFNEYAPHDPKLRPITQHSISPFRLPRGAVSDLFSHTEGRRSNPLS